MAFDPGGLFEALDRGGVDYVLVGGFAGTLHGASRPTNDIDIVPRWSQSNLEKLCGVLRDLDAYSVRGPRVEGDAILPAVLIDREIVNWETRLGPIDTLMGIPDENGMPVMYDQLMERASAVEVGELTVPVGSLGDVIVSKEFASRAKDGRALPELRQLEQQKRPGPGPGAGMSPEERRRAARRNLGQQDRGPDLGR